MEYFGDIFFANIGGGGGQKGKYATVQLSQTHENDMQTCKNEIGMCQHFLKSPVLKHLKDEIHARKTRLACIFVSVAMPPDSHRHEKC